MITHSQNTTEPVILLTPKELLDGKEHYLIPMYQRNYAWGNSEIEQLIVDIMDAQIDAKKSNDYKNYYLGTLVVFERPQLSSKRKVFEVIDGQQRFTTLSLLIIYLKNHFKTIGNNYEMSWYLEQNIEFESRPKSSQTLELLLNDNLETYEHIYKDKLNPAIINGYKSISEVMKSKFITPDNESQPSNTTIQEFCDYLFQYVQIARVPVPDETDLNHYFEVMNNRGEQLEKHEIIKARLLSVVEKADENEIALADKRLAKALIHNVWEACANMNKYVQYGFNPTLRFKLFSDNLTLFKPEDFDQLLKIYRESDVAKISLPDNEQHSNCDDNLQNNDAKVLPSLYDILDDNFITPPDPSDTTDKEDDDGETYYSLINFSGFLLHVLRIMINIQSSYQEDIALDDKQLLTQFETYILNPSNLETVGTSNDGHSLQTKDKITPLSQVKTFVYALLKSKFIFDHFIIKRNTQDTKGQWTLNKLVKGEDKKNSYYKNSFENDNNKLVMLQSAFHVSTPTTNYKHWLNAVLYYSFSHYKHDDTGLDGAAYINHLEGLARAFMLRRYLTDEPDDYHQIIYQTLDFNKVSFKQTDDNLSPDKLCIKIKQYLRYGKIRNIFVFNYLDYLLWLEDKNSDFTFTARSSVEHFYPQNKRDDKLFINDKDSEDTLLHSFGNLCLISHSLNSRVSNDMPDVKVKYFLDSGHIDSLKLSRMIDCIKNKKAIWNKEMIQAHEDQMLKIMMQGLNLNSEDTHNE
ncbi:DUF262 domain-containing protein [Psychrobacter arenosus]|uniref:DUF262 domain-containing protein n=1 Tax=Psychrobacter arenosus TaxID=256326 RepID=UPI0019181321|nr:DUF262 domain-containing protein [Psychrobacter arenosus]